MPNLVDKQIASIVKTLNLDSTKATTDIIKQVLTSVTSQTAREDLLKKMLGNDPKVYLAIKRISDDLGLIEKITRVLTAPSIPDDAEELRTNTRHTGDNLYDLDENDEFISGIAATGSIGKLCWANPQGTVALQSGQSFHPGIVRLSSTAVLNNVGVLSLMNTAGGLVVIDAADVARVEFIVSPVQITLVDRRYGLFPTGSIITAGAVTGIYFEEGSAAANIKCVTKSGVATTTDSGVPTVAGNWFKLTIVISQALGTVDFYINDLLVAAHTTNIPTGVMQVGFACETLAGAVKNVDIDYFRIQGQPIPYASRWT